MSKLELRHFRNLGVQELSFPPEGVAIIGRNAQGKTNLLEAVYYLESLRSFRAAPDDQLVAFGDTVFHVAGVIHDGRDDNETRIGVGFDSRRKKKRVVVDGSPASRLTEALGRLGAIVFSPGDVSLVSEGPAVRRRFLDRVLSLNVPGYLNAVQRYRKVLSQRNACLKSGGTGDAVRAWNGPLFEFGSDVVRMRRDWVAQWAEHFRSSYLDVSGGESAEIRYTSSIGTLEGEDLAGEFERALAAKADQEARQRTTVVGPHRDDLVITLSRGSDTVAARAFGSGGQQRTAALALRLVEAATIRSLRDVEPVLLLDDAFAELDQPRSERIMDILSAEHTGQVILTAPKESDVSHHLGNLPRWGIEGGVVQA